VTVARIATVTVSEGGPLLVRGPIRVLDAEGREVPTRRRVNALCRCGRSTLQPFCDGTHKVVPFTPRRVNGTASPARAGSSPLAG
jgi:CDGSH-type Zn-finger protein